MYIGTWNDLEMQKETGPSKQRALSHGYWAMYIQAVHTFRKLQGFVLWMTDWSWVRIVSLLLEGQENESCLQESRFPEPMADIQSYNKTFQEQQSAHCVQCFLHTCLFLLVTLEHCLMIIVYASSLWWSLVKLLGLGSFYHFFDISLI